MAVLAAPFAILVQQGLFGLGVLNAAAYASTAFTVGSALITTGAGAALSFAASALAPKAKRPDPIDGRLNLKQAIPPRIFITGVARTGGNYFFFETRGGALYQGVIFCDGPVHDILHFYLNDDLVQLDGNNSVFVPAHYTRKGDRLVFINEHLGTVPGTPDGILTAAFPESWGFQHRLDGVCYAVIAAAPVKLEDFQKHYTKGQPQLQALVAGAKMHDPRVGGNLLAFPSTWTYSENPVVSLRWYLTTYAGLSLSDATWITPNNAEWNAAANYCEVQVAKVGGFEQRYRCWLRFTADTPPTEIIQTYLRACDGWLYTKADGTLGIKVGYEAPTVSIDADHIRSVTMKIGSRQERAINEFKLSYLSPDHGYKSTPGAPWVDNVSIAKRGRLSRDFDADMVPSHPQARRLLKLMFERENARITGSVTTDIAGLNAMGERYIYLMLPHVGWTTCEVVKLSLDIKSMGVEIQFRSVSQAIIGNEWNPATEEGSTPAAVVPPAPADLTVPTGLTVVEDTTNFLRAIWYRAGVTVYNFDLRYRTTDDGSGLPGPWTDLPNVVAVESGDNFHFDFLPVFESPLYHVEVRGSFGSRVSAWSPTATSVPNSADVIDLGDGTLFDTGDNTGDIIGTD